MGLLSLRRGSDLTRWDEFDRAMQRWWEGGFPTLAKNGSDWVPSVDISESDSEIKVTLDAPGMTPEDIEISLADHELTIRGERNQEKKEQEESFHRVERQYGSFCRRLILPTSVDTEKVEASSDNGVITITAPKLPEAQAKSIKVKPK